LPKQILHNFHINQLIFSDDYFEFTCVKFFDWRINWANLTVKFVLWWDLRFFFLLNWIRKRRVSNILLYGLLDLGSFVFTKFTVELQLTFRLDSSLSRYILQVQGKFETACLIYLMIRNVAA
jgi:hypothetical protein